MANDAGPRLAPAEREAPDAADVSALLDAWRARGADRLDPVRFHLIEALERRRAAHAGEARRLIDARLAQRLDAFARDLERDVTPVFGNEARRSALGSLVDSIPRAEPVHTPSRVRHEPDPELVDYFRKTWSRVRTEKQLRQSLDQVPRNAGPLNSSSLVHRALSLMREVSPGYLQHFLAYADALSWVEQLNASVGAAAPVKEAPRAAGGKKGTRGKGR
ncbi:conserved hypothetical protein [Paraburkholderia unamae]|uniref:DUF2894 domain-containing protein n=1 Tax=Paraburkholderia unamae TaxID=219649 RepID=UPI001CB33658|nr:DUF2894 domain-containing protein [Paraburkholderia unamae]CAG9249869.1 conserved hypothetical protein [Paraburkholderia unamae]